jgi:hypothetical protein
LFIAGPPLSDEISWRKFPIILTEGLIFFKIYLGQECYYIAILLKKLEQQNIDRKQFMGQNLQSSIVFELKLSQKTRSGRIKHLTKPKELFAN